MSKLRAMFEQPMLPLILRRVFRDLCRTDRTLWREVSGETDRTLSPDVVATLLAERDTSFFEWAGRFLEQANKAAVERHEHIVRKTLALVGWFGLVLTGLSIPNRLFRRPFLVGSWGLGSAVLWCAALVMFVWSLFAACRVLWRIVLLEDRPAWLVEDQIVSAGALRKERVLDLLERVPENTDSIAVKGILYQGAVWSFFLSALLAVGSLLVSAVGTVAGARKMSSNQGGTGAIPGMLGSVGPGAHAGASMGIELSHIWTVAGVLVTLQLAAFARRIDREIVIGDQGRATWLPPADLLNLTAMLVALLGVFIVPIAGVASANLPRVALGLSILLFAGYPFALAGHYHLYTTGRHTPRYVTAQETIAILITVVLCTVYLVTVWSVPPVISDGTAVR